MSAVTAIVFPFIMDSAQGNKFAKDLRDGEPQMETRILESSINKICSLLAVGFGDAGAEVGLKLYSAQLPARSTLHICCQ